MDKDLPSHFASEISDIVRRAFEAGVRAGRADAEERHARDLLKAQEASAKAQGTAVAKAVASAVTAALAEKSSSHRGNPNPNRNKEWGKIRPAIYAAIVEGPGRTMQGLLEATGAKQSTLRLTLADFVQEGYLRKDEAGGYHAIDPDTHTALIVPKPRVLKDAIIRVVREHPSATTNFVISRLGEKSTSVRATLYALRDDGEVVGSGSGWILAPEA